MVKIELTKEDIEIINRNINKQKMNLEDTAVNRNLEAIFHNHFQNAYINIDILNGILSNADKTITNEELIGSTVVLVKKSYLKNENLIIARDYIISKEHFQNIGTLPWETYSYDSVMLINLDTGIADRKIAYPDDEDAALEILLDGYYVSSITKRAR